MRHRTGVAVAIGAVIAANCAVIRSAIAQTTQPSAAASSTSTSSAAPSDTAQLGKVVVTSDLDQSREQIAPSLGAVTYTVTPTQIQSIPGGSNAPFQQVLLRMPGVVEDSFGQEHVRGEHANLTYRVNGVLLPQPLNGFGQELDTRLIQSVTLVTGSLPAEFGFHTSGIVDVTTKTGDTLNHNEVSIYGGSYDTLQQSVQVGGTAGKLDYFVVASQNHNGIGIENPTDSHRPLHDYTDQEKAFGYFSYRLDDTSRLSLLANASYADFDIPVTPGLAPAFNLAGQSSASAKDSSKVAESQNEQEYYTVVSYQKSTDTLSFQVSAFSRYGQITFDPDETRDLIFQGVSSAVYNNFVTNGLQLDSSWIVNDKHTIRFGAISDYTIENLGTTTGVFATDAAGAQASDSPTYISDNSQNHAVETGGYVQDEWKITPAVTLNYGIRYDRFDSNFDTDDQFSPRANVVWKIDDPTTIHLGYARYFVPPPVQNVEIGQVKRFDGTTNAAGVELADPPKVEKSNYFDIGISRQIAKPWQVSVDGFYKDARDLVDLGQFGTALIETPFNYRQAHVYGAELSSTYRQGGFSAFGNVGVVETRARDIDSQQFQIDPDELAFIKDHYIKLDHEAEVAGSLGVAYEWRHDRVYLDFLAATGLRSGFANTGQVGPHYPVNVGYEHIFTPAFANGHAIRWRVDVVNVFDQKYELRDGSGVGVGAPQFGQRLSFFTGVTYEF
jgi:outer membrane receptor protein involved in Fe transport